MSTWHAALRLVMVVMCCAPAVTAAAAGRWTEQQAKDWYARQGFLVGANFSGCDLRGADLTGARPQRLDLTGADLRGARIDAALWVGATLVGAVVDVEQAVLFAAAHGLVLGADGAGER